MILFICGTDTPAATAASLVVSRSIRASIRILVTTTIIILTRQNNYTKVAPIRAVSGRLACDLDGLDREQAVWEIGMSLSEIEIRTPYVVAERLIVALMLRFKPAKNVLSDTLVSCRHISLGTGCHAISIRHVWPPLG
jgi:hypothetical protein